MWQKSIIVKQKFSKKWSENFLLSTIFKFSFIFVCIMVSNTLIFEPNFFSAPIAQLIERRPHNLEVPGSNPGQGKWCNFFYLHFFAFLAYLCFTKTYFCHLFSLVNIFLSTFLQPLYLVTKKFFFKISIWILP